MARDLSAARATIHAGDVDGGVAILRDLLADSNITNTIRGYAHPLLVEAYLQAGRLEDAVQAGEAARAEPLEELSRLIIKDKLAEAMALAGRDTEALARYREIVAGDPNDLENGWLRRLAWLQVAMLEQRLGHADAAREAHRQMVRELVQRFFTNFHELILDDEQLEPLSEIITKRHGDDERSQLVILVGTFFGRVAEEEPVAAMLPLIERILAILLDLFPTDLLSIFPTRAGLVAMKDEAIHATERERATYLGWIEALRAQGGKSAAMAEQVMALMSARTKT